ncbi:MAG: alpha-amylase family glycosyl hydrolase [Pseudomonadota bacterium]
MMFEWWRGCVIYQVYPRSFQDSNGDGIGDLFGIYERLDYIARLGVDAIWISPFFKSPMKDFGYDISDYKDVDPVFGSLEDFKKLLEKAHSLGIKVLIDQVWSHTSDQHAWFKESRQDIQNNRKDWYVWAEAKADGTPPNNWLSYFGGPAWTWDARRQQYYLHHFLKEQPTLNLWHPEVRNAIKDIAAFWLDMGVDGFRLDVAHAYLYDQALRDNPARKKGEPYPSDLPSSNPMTRQVRLYSMNVPENLQWIEELRGFINASWPDRCLLGEAGGDDSEKEAVVYTQTGKRFNLAYSFGLVGSPMSKNDIVKTVSRVESLLEDGWVCWATNNHDFKRAVSRIPGETANIIKARFNAILGLSLRGNYCMFQGEELGLPQAELSFEDLQDPYDKSLYPEHVGRDGCRTPIPWQHDIFHAGFSTSIKSWLPVCSAHVTLAVDLQENDESSTLKFYQKFLAFRKTSLALRVGYFALLNTPDPIVSWIRFYDKEQFMFIFNVSTEETNYVFEEFVFNPIAEFCESVKIEGNTMTLSPYGFAILQKA